MTMYSFKRGSDLCISVLLILITAPFLFVVAFAIKITSPGPVLFWSLRMGRNGIPFNMPKFRTMKLNAPLVPTDAMPEPTAYVTKVGRFLRKFSIDELPQLYSILKGDMSLVGPRPVLTTQTELIIERSDRGVDNLRPGVTGWAQINGRDCLTNDQKVKLDAEYLKKASLSFDLLILWRTVSYVLKSRDVQH